MFAERLRESEQLAEEIKLSQYSLINITKNCQGTMEDGKRKSYTAGKQRKAYGIKADGRGARSVFREVIQSKEVLIEPNPSHSEIILL